MSRENRRELRSPGDVRPSAKPARAGERKQLYLYGSPALLNSEILLQFEDEVVADEWERQLQLVIDETLAAEPDDAQSDATAAAGAGAAARLTGVLAPLKEEHAALRDLSEAARIAHFKLVHMLDSYVGIVQATLCDLVPKAITARLLNATRDAINARLEPTLGRGSVAAVVAELMAPTPEHEASLARLQAEVGSLRECARVVAHVPCHVRAAPSPATNVEPTRSPLSELADPTARTTLL